ncbi:hypothetical protein B0H67DRAFT_679912 [Lasiosphaeris hirsuta]|uniref:CENP-V/GFA domain-containing protein n=1 Tax=Lasiosphaeris hirsuta TaxID=260670 RepID=A0AA40AYA5_9PEZI|nr:hypothetical protein B0H67DRAFT_679912 [Lasiosphaeris hirsuta]
MADTTPTRRPFRGSCHCKTTQFVIFLTLPHTPPPEDAPIPGPSPPQAFYRCNCTICQKTGFFHVRVPFAPDDFFLLSPLDPFAVLGNYQRLSKQLNFLFCKNCGTRCMTYMGEGEVVDVDLAELGVELEAGQEAKTKVWRPKREGWKEGKANGCYLSVNGHAIEAGQEGFDLTQLVDNKWVLYYDFLELGGGEAKAQRYGTPHEYGTY